MSNAARLTARCTLGETPLIHLLVSLLDKEITGTLVLETQDGARSAIFVRAGTPTKVYSPKNANTLGQLLVKSGHLEALVAAQTYDLARTTQQLHGQVLLQQHVISAEVINRTLTAQLLLQLVWVAKLPSETMVGLFDGVDLLQKWPAEGHISSTLSAIWAVARATLDRRVVQSVLGQLSDRPLRLHRLAQPQQFGFSAAENRVVETLQAPACHMRLLTDGTGLPETIVGSIVYILAITLHLDRGQQRMPVGVLNRGSGVRPRTSQVENPQLAALNCARAGSGVQTLQTGAASHIPDLDERAERSRRYSQALLQAEQMLERHKLLAAAHAVQVALQHEPQGNDAIALQAWIQACSTSLQEDLLKLVKVLTESLERMPFDEKIRFRRAQLLARLGRSDEALREWRLLVELNPKHVDAQRELRLWEMRHRRKMG